MGRMDGIDVSHHNGTVNWHTVVVDGDVWWAATKATEGNGFTSSALTTNRNGMASAGIGYRGLYHWLNADSSAQAQADWYLSKIGALAEGEFVMLDAEEDGCIASN